VYEVAGKAWNLRSLLGYSAILWSKWLIFHKWLCAAHSVSVWPCISASMAIQCNTIQSLSLFFVLQPLSCNGWQKCDSKPCVAGPINKWLCGYKYLCGLLIQSFDCYHSVFYHTDCVVKCLVTIHSTSTWCCLLFWCLYSVHWSDLFAAGSAVQWLWSLTSDGLSVCLCCSEVMQWCRGMHSHACLIFLPALMFCTEILIFTLYVSLVVFQICYSCRERPLIFSVTLMTTIEVSSTCLLIWPYRYFCDTGVKPWRCNSVILLLLTWSSVIYGSLSLWLLTWYLLILGWLSTFKSVCWWKWWWWRCSCWWPIRYAVFIHWLWPFSLSFVCLYHSVSDTVTRLYILSCLKPEANSRL
jgi:hypothetical protein